MSGNQTLVTSTEQYETWFSNNKLQRKNIISRAIIKELNKFMREQNKMLSNQISKCSDWVIAHMCLYFRTRSLIPHHHARIFLQAHSSEVSGGHGSTL